MLQNGNGAADEARGVPELTQLGCTGVRGNSFSIENRQAVCAELFGSDCCSALGITARGNAPVLALCRALIKAGQDPDRPLLAYRGDMLCLRVRSIGEGAQLTIEDDRRGRPRLRCWRNRAIGCGAAPPITQTLTTPPAGRRHDGAAL
jgi:hypothetical protein